MNEPNSTSGPPRWTTSLSESTAETISIRGYDLAELIGTVSFPAVVHLLYTGELPDPATARLIDAVMVASIDHGAGAPSVLAARTAISGGASLQAAAAAGLLTLGEFHGAAVESSMHTIATVADAARASDRRTLDAVADELVAEWRAQGKRVPGFGHRQHKRRDPRLDRLLAVARDADVAGDHLAAAIALEAALTRAIGRPMPINIDGVMAAILNEVGFPSDLGNALFIASRLAGILAHANEERQTMTPMRRIDPMHHAYSGPAPAGLPTTGVGRFTGHGRTPMSARHPTAAEQLVGYLERRGVRHVFGLCGHTNIAVLSAMAGSGIQFVNVRHEQVASHAADGYARVTGRASVVLSHLSPGLTNAATGVANAALDCIPMVVIAGDVPSHYYGRHPHQEVNLHADASQFEIYRPFVKRAWRVEKAELLPEIIEKAFLLAENGQPGPVLVDVPMDVFSQPVDPALFARLDHGTKTLHKPSLDDETAHAIVTRLAEAAATRHLRRRRCVVVEGQRRTPNASSTTWAFRSPTASWARAPSATTTRWCWG